MSYTIESTYGSDTTNRVGQKEPNTTTNIIGASNIRESLLPLVVNDRGQLAANIPAIDHALDVYGINQQNGAGIKRATQHWIHWIHQNPTASTEQTADTINGASHLLIELALMSQAHDSIVDEPQRLIPLQNPEIAFQTQVAKDLLAKRKESLGRNIAQLDEMQRIIAWTARNSHEPHLGVITTICPHYWIYTDYKTGKVTFTMDGIDDEIGLIGEGVAKHAPYILKALVQSTGKNVLWLPGYASFEATHENVETIRRNARERKNAAGENYGPESTELTQEEMLRRIEGSGEAFSAEMQEYGIQAVSIPERLGISLEQYFELKQLLDPEDYEISRKGDLGDAIRDGRDWVMMSLLAMAHDHALLEGASFTVARQMMTLATYDIVEILTRQEQGVSVHNLQSRLTNMHTCISSLASMIADPQAAKRLKALLNSKPEEIANYLVPSLGIVIRYAGSE